MGGLRGDEPFAVSENWELTDEEVIADGLLSHIYGGDCHCPTMPIW